MATWFITGASTGLGRGIAEAVLKGGDSAVVTARDPHRMDDLVAAYGDRVLAVPLEVTDPAQRRSSVEAAVERFGSIDVLVNNAGRGLFGSVEDTSEEDIRLLYETNLFGPIGMMREALPHISRGGAVVNVSSMGVMFENATGNAYYVSSKAALEMLSDVLRNELKGRGIDVVIVEPGSFRTEFRVSSIQNRPGVKGDYSGPGGEFKRFIEENPYNQPGDPAKGGEAIYRALESAKRPKVLVLGRNMVETAQATLEHRIEEVGRWKDLADGTDFDP